MLVGEIACAPAGGADEAGAAEAHSIGRRRCALLAVAVLAGTALSGGVPAAAAAPRPSTAAVETYLEQIRDEPGRLEAFLTELPKGADLHTHLSGAVPTGRLLEWAIDDRLCVDERMVAVAPPCRSGARPAADARTDRAFRDRIIAAWSMKGHSERSGESGHDHFFATFAKFGAASENKPRMLAAIASQAAAEHTSYLEPLISRQSEAIKKLAATVTWSEDLAAMTRQITAKPEFDRIVAAADAETDADLARTRELLGCDTARPDPGCAVDIRIDHQVARIGEPARVLTNLLVGFALAERNPRVVGVNLVQPEDDPKAISEYGRQMRMIAHLRRSYRTARVSLHAGELTPQFAGPAALRSHIRQAVLVARADRIGHGVDIAGEDDSTDTLRTMAARNTLVEINLTSNCQILRVCGSRHPFALYRRHSVPVALSTDDQGIEHTDLSHEYARALRDFDLTYADLKTLARTSLEHAFLPGASLWRAVGEHRPVAACAGQVPGTDRPGGACAAFLRASDKARVQWQHESDLRRFEQRYTASPAPSR
ncbi:hypothetical protein [Nonomuraea sp. NPDC049709]|uniref:hypothetical protein n=1 Tax=Nonomuraea sp. NPDC049709 TaxID=3154736 RepID=UPI00341ACC1E